MLKKDYKGFFWNISKKRSEYFNQIPRAWNVSYNPVFFSCNTIALGNGKGCRDTENIITRMKEDGKLKNDVVYRLDYY
jgi:hypothetical protein